MRIILAILLLPMAWAQGDWREIDAGGRKLRVQMIQGQAIWEGDIVLGPIPVSAKDARASVVVDGPQFRWPGNTIPYTIDAAVPAKDRIENAARHWNENTPVRLVPRTNEANYVEFRQRNDGLCSSSLGMLGGRQFIDLSDNCPATSIAHEIGHAFGLLHTQSREDRDTFIRVNEAGMDGATRLQYSQPFATTSDIGAYSYDSLMHYSATGTAGQGTSAIETIPKGIPIGQRAGLSASDIDAIVRLTGGEPRRTVVASNPPGLTVRVDGETVRTPAEFDWPAGSIHTLRVDDVVLDGVHFRFGRWSDFGDREHTIAASPETTVYTVHMRRLIPLPLTANPAAGGRIAIAPAPVDGLTPDGQLVELRAEPEPGFSFLNWSGFGYFSTHGGINPVRFVLSTPGTAYTANFTRSAPTTVTTSPPGLRISVDGTAATSPQRFAWVPGSRHDIAIETGNQSSQDGAARHTFRAWDDGGAQRHTVTASADGGVVTAEFDTQYGVIGIVSPGIGGRVALDPPPTTDGFLPAGATVTAEAIPRPGFAFAGWSGTLTGGEARKTFTVDGIVTLESKFAQPATLTAAGVLNGASYFAGAVAPGEIVAIFGLELGPAELAGLTLTAQGRVDTAAGGVRVLFDGTPAPVLYASSSQVGVVVPFNVSGKPLVRVQLDNNGRVTNLLTMNLVTTAPAIFTANSSGKGGGAILNADGSLNTEANPAERGSIVVLYATGLGVMRPAMNDGEAAAPPYPVPAAQVRVRIADRICEVLYAGAAPGLVAGLVQFNVRVPSDIGPGVMPVTVEAANVQSPRTVSLAVR